MTENIVNYNLSETKNLDLADVCILKEKLTAIDGLVLKVKAGQYAKKELKEICKELKDNYGLVIRSENMNKLGM